MPERASRTARPHSGLAEGLPQRFALPQLSQPLAAPASESAATNAPLMAPTDVPTIRSGLTPASDSARSMPTSCAPRMPPPPSTNAVSTPSTSSHQANQIGVGARRGAWGAAGRGGNGAQAAGRGGGSGSARTGRGAASQRGGGSGSARTGRGAAVAAGRRERQCADRAGAASQRGRVTRHLHESWWITRAICRKPTTIMERVCGGAAGGREVRRDGLLGSPARAAIVWKCRYCRCYRS